MKESVRPITPIASRARSKITTVPRKVGIEDTNSTGKVDNTSTVQRTDEKEELNVKLKIVRNEPSTTKRYNGKDRKQTMEGSRKKMERRRRKKERNQGSKARSQVSQMGIT